MKKTEAAPPPLGHGLRRIASFARQSIRTPRQVGSIIPSSTALADAMADSIVLSDSVQVVELGAGTGAITQSILDRGVSPSQYLGLEICPELVTLLRNRFPKNEFSLESAENLSLHLADRGSQPPSHVIASLPWSLMPSDLRRSILLEIAKVIRPGGSLVTFNYISTALLPAAATQVSRDFEEFFAVTARTKTVWRNIPPANVWTFSHS